jgi:hypothetical protein
MLLSIPGTLDGRRYPPAGEEFDVPDVVGANLCARGQAEPVAEVEAPRKAVAKRAEKRA